MKGRFVQLPSVGKDRFVEIHPPDAEPEISILMPLYNQRKYVGAAISSILAQEGVVAEIVISDDASTDGTFEEALHVVGAWLSKRECRHRIVVRTGQNRLWRDHLPLLVDNAICDVVCQAHGDDLSAHGRCRALIDTFNSDPLISLVTSEEGPLHSVRRGRHRAEATDLMGKLEPFAYGEIIDGYPLLIGAFLAWRKSAVQCFVRLDRGFSAASHDRILTFRASLAGKVVLLKVPLVRKRTHPFQASRLMFHEPDRHCHFGHSLFRISVFLAMKQDLDRACELGLIDRMKKKVLEGEIDSRLSIFQQRLVESFRVYTLAGKHIAWVDDAAIRRANVNLKSRLRSGTLGLVRRIQKQVNPNGGSLSQVSGGRPFERREQSPIP